MALETGVVYIEDLVATNPVGATDLVEFGDDHIRNTKTAVQGSFPSLGQQAVTKTAAEINDLATKTGTETLTNKELTAPILTDPTITPGATNPKLILNTKIIDIGDWNMDTTVSITKAHGLTQSKIRSVTGLIRNDTGSQHWSANLADGAGTLVSSIGVSSTAITIYRQSGTIFDTDDFDSTSYNRGWITVQYID